MLRQRPHVMPAALAAACVLLTVNLIAPRRAEATAAAKAAAPSAGYVVDLGRLLEGLDEREQLEKDLQARIETRQKQLDEVRKQMNDVREELAIEARGSEPYRERVREMLELEATAKVRQETLQTIIAVEKGTMLVDLYAKISEAAQTVAEREGYDAIVIDDSKGDLPQQPTEQVALQQILSRRVLYAAPRIDVTDNLRTLMNNQWRAGRP